MNLDDPVVDARGGGPVGSGGASWACRSRGRGAFVTGKTLAAFLRRFHRAQRGTSDVEYFLLTGLIVLPLLVVPWMVKDANRAVFHRIGQWIHLPFP
jgi:Flp pilus assembly pilin Flp